MKNDAPLYGWRWLFWFIIGLIVGLIILKLTIL
nr:MAG TPA: HCMV UL42 [Caudoviricetes sp.]